MLRRAAVIVTVLAACGSSPPDAEHPAPSEAKHACEAMADHLVTVMKAGLPGAAGSDDPTEVTDKISRVFVDRCFSDQWTVAAIHCFTTAATLDATSECAPFLTVPQRDAADHAIDDAFGGAPAPK